jgi:mono/diheme cytochrome c family protein
MFRGFILGIIFTVLAAAAAGYYALTSGLIPANADAKPGQIERFIAGTSLQATLDKDAPKESNPVQLTDENLVNGIKFYETNCAICHGTAEGDTSASPVAKGENPSPPRNWLPTAWRTIRRARCFSASLHYLFHSRVRGWSLL